MAIESAIRLLAGSLILISLALYQFVSPWWLLLTVFVGLNLAQSAFTGFCPAAMIFKRIGLGSSCCGNDAGGLNTMSVSRQRKDSGAAC
jgi:hypothetical protein